MIAMQFQIRPIKPSDKAGLRAAGDQASSESIYRRFLGPHPRLSAAELRYFTEVDHHDHEALVAVDPDNGDSMGIARYVRDTEHGDSAEIAFFVPDPWQGQGVGKALLQRLVVRARAEGIHRFTALMLADNWQMRHLLATLGDPVVVGTEAGTVELAVSLDEAPRSGAIRVGDNRDGQVVWVPRRLRARFVGKMAHNRRSNKWHSQTISPG
jgi:protein lysine acetyltransferase